MKKELYQQPNTKVLVVRVEEGILTQSGGFSSKGTELMTVEQDEDF